MEKREARSNNHRIKRRAVRRAGGFANERGGQANEIASRQEAGGAHSAHLAVLQVLALIYPLLMGHLRVACQHQNLVIIHACSIMGERPRTNKGARLKRLRFGCGEMAYDPLTLATNAP